MFAQAQRDLLDTQTSLLVSSEALIHSTICWHLYGCTLVFEGPNLTLLLYRFGQVVVPDWSPYCFTNSAKVWWLIFQFILNPCNLSILQPKDSFSRVTVSSRLPIKQFALLIWVHHCIVWCMAQVENGVPQTFMTMNKYQERTKMKMQKKRSYTPPKKPKILSREGEWSRNTKILIHIKVN